MEFAPGTGALRCPYCQHEEAVIPAARTIQEHPFDELARRPRTALASHVWTCQKCGATTDSDLLASKCQFCGAPLVDAGEANEQIAPEAVLPFEVDRAGVRSALREWVASRRFAPRNFRSVSEAESLSGTYVPHWTFDADTTSDYTGQRGDHYWETETYTTTVDGQTQTQTRQVMRTRWTPCVRPRRPGVRRRDGPGHGAPHRGAPGQTGAVAARVPRWRTSRNTCPATARCGMTSSPSAASRWPKQEMAKVIERDCRNDIGGDEQRLHNVSTSYADIMYKLVLLPVWVVAYLYGGKTWQVLVNGRTGEVIGSRPYSKVKIAAAVLAALIVIAAVIVALVVAHRGG